MTRVDITSEVLERAAQLARGDVPVVLGSWKDVREAFDRGIVTRDEARRKLGLEAVPAPWWRRLWATIVPRPHQGATTTSRGSAAWTR